MGGHLNTYLARLTLAGYRPATVEARGRCLRAFAATVDDITTASREDCETYLARPLALASRRAYADHLRSFYRYLCDEGLREDDPTERLPRFRRALRHYAGTAWYHVSGQDLLTTARLLRHSDVSTTQGYAAIEPTRPAEVVNLMPMPTQREKAPALPGGGSAGANVGTG